MNTSMCGLAKRNFNILSRAGPNRWLFDIFDNLSIDIVSHPLSIGFFCCQVQVCKQYCRVIGERSMMALSVCPCRLHVRDRWSMKGLISILSCCILFVSVVGCRCWLNVGCWCWLSGVYIGGSSLLWLSGVRCRMLTVGCLVSLSMVLVGSWLSIVCCWLFIVGVDCRSFFPFVGAHLWLSESLNFLQVLLVASLDNAVLTKNYSVFFYYSNLSRKVRRISELIDFYQTFEILYCRNISYRFVCNPLRRKRTTIFFKDSLWIDL